MCAAATQAELTRRLAVSGRREPGLRPWLLGEADLLPLQGGVVEGGWPPTSQPTC